jgi:hypothetical protein
MTLSNKIKPKNKLALDKFITASKGDDKIAKLIDKNIKK